jgi:hypothetical protein
VPKTPPLTSPTAAARRNPHHDAWDRHRLYPAAFAMGVHARRPPERILEVAQALAADVCTRHGAIQLMPEPG